MEKKPLIAGIAVCLSTLISCSQHSNTVDTPSTETATAKQYTVQHKPHNYGGWYCPDNLNGFPAVDIQNWKNVPAINGHMPTKEETRTEASLIFVDPEEYPNAQVLDIHMPKLARYYSTHTKKEELVIVIQAFSIGSDSIVGFRYINGGNGSAHLNEVKFLSKQELEALSPGRFVTKTLTINASKAKVWEVLTQPQYRKALQAIFYKDYTFNGNWNESAKVNFNYPHAGNITSEFADALFGNQYIQIDYTSDANQYVEKFLVSTNEETGETSLQLVCGPYMEDYNTQKQILEQWADKVKALSEKP